MTEEERLLDQFMEALIDGRLKFTDLLKRYVVYLEYDKKQNRSKIVESGVLLTMWKNPKLNLGTKKQLLDRTNKAIDDAEIWDKKQEPNE